MRMDVICNHSVETSFVEMRLVFDCKECPVEADLKNKECMAGVLKALTDNFNSDSVILSDYAELRYSGPSMQMLKRMVELSNEIENLAMRNPVKEYFSHLKSQSARDKRRSICNSCKNSPRKVFPQLRKQLLEDVEGFYGGMLHFSREVDGISAGECQACAQTTEEALVYLFNLMEDYRAFLYYEGFRVVI